MRRLRDRGLPVLLWALLLSTILHFAAGPLIAALVYLHMLPTPPEIQSKPEEEVVTSTAVRIERRAQPRPAHPAKPRTAVRPVVIQQRPVPKPRPRTVAVQTPLPATPTPTPPRAVNVTPQPQPRTRRREELQPQHQRALSAENIAAQEREFARTITQARKADNPLVAAQSTAVPATTTTKRYHLDFSGAQGSLGQGQGYLEPIRMWHEESWTYYYVRYEVEYPDGTIESGVVPWPIRYPPGGDPFALGVRHLPLPGPLPGYELPPGQDLQPLIKFCLEHHFEFCPIEHD